MVVYHRLHSSCFSYLTFHWRLQLLLSKTYVKKSEAYQLMEEMLQSSRAAIDDKLDEWNAVLSQQAESRDQREQVRELVDDDLRHGYDVLRSELQVAINSRFFRAALKLI